MPLYEITFQKPPNETHYVLATDPKLGKVRVKQQIEWRDKKEIAHSALSVRQMEYNERVTLCSGYKPLLKTYKKLQKS